MSNFPIPPQEDLPKTILLIFPNALMVVQAAPAEQRFAPCRRRPGTSAAVCRRRRSRGTSKLQVAAPPARTSPPSLSNPLKAKTALFQLRGNRALPRPGSAAQVQPFHLLSKGMSAWNYTEHVERIVSPVSKQQRAPTSYLPRSRGRGRRGASLSARLPRARPPE